MWPMILAWLLKPRNLAIAVGVVAVLGLGASTSIYRSKYIKAKEQLRKIEDARKTVEEELKKTKLKLQVATAEIEEKYQKEKAKMSKNFEGQKKELEALLTGAHKSIAKLEDQNRSIEEKRKQKEKEIEEDKEKLRLAQDELEQMKKSPQLGALQDDLSKKEDEIRGLQVILQGKNAELDRIADELEKQRTQKEGFNCLKINVPEDVVRNLK